MKNKGQEITKGVIVNIFMIIVVVICLFPVLWMCAISIKTVGEKVSGFNALVINEPTLENFKHLFTLVPIWNNLYNSLFTTIIGTITTLFLVFILVF